MAVAKPGPKREPPGPLPSFVLVESKSLPRSGLHYLRRSLAQALGEDFSFCEWYHAPGCCRRMPCRRTGFERLPPSPGRTRLRLIKSHDLKLEDPATPTHRGLRRVVLIREPLYVLTSWFAIDQLREYQQDLAQAGVSLPGIWREHEGAAVAAAYRILDRRFKAPDEAFLVRWLQLRTRYCTRFLQKWMAPASLAGDRRYTRFITYEGVAPYVASVVAELRPGTRARTPPADFRPRSDPYAAASDRLSDYMRRNASRFVEAAARIKERAPRRFAQMLDHSPAPPSAGPRAPR